MDISSRPNNPQTAIEIRGFGKLRDLFAERHWGFPYSHQLKKPLSGKELLEELRLAPDQVEAIMINGLVQTFEKIINAGDRIALVPPGTPGPYRVLLGIVDRSKTPNNQSCE